MKPTVFKVFNICIRALEAVSRRFSDEGYTLLQEFCSNITGQSSYTEALSPIVLTEINQILRNATDQLSKSGRNIVNSIR